MCRRQCLPTYSHKIWYRIDERAEHSGYGTLRPALSIVLRMNEIEKVYVSGEKTESYFCIHKFTLTRSYTDWMDALSNNNNRGSYLHSEIPLWNCYYYVVCTIWFSVVWMPCSISKFVKGWMVKVCCFGLLLAEKEREREHVSFFLHVYTFPIKNGNSSNSDNNKKKEHWVDDDKVCVCECWFFPVVVVYSFQFLWVF